METLDKAWHTAADTLKNELSHLHSAERQWVNQHGTEPMAGVQGKGTITDPYDGGNRDVQPGAPRGIQNTGHSVDLGSAHYGKGTTEQSYSSYKISGTGGVPEQRSSHITTSSYTTGPRGAAQGSGTGSGYASLSSMVDGSSTMQGSGTAQGLGGMSRSGISQGSGAAAGGSGMKSTLAHGSGSGSGSGSGIQTHQLSSTTHGSGVTHAYERAGLGELGQKAGLGDYTTTALGSGGIDTSHHTSGMMGSTVLRDTAGSARSTGITRGVDTTSGAMGTTRDAGLRDTTHGHLISHGGATTRSSGLDKTYDQSSGIMDTTRGVGMTDSTQRLDKSNIGGTAIKSSGHDSRYDQGSSMAGSTRDTSLRDTTHGASKHSGLGDFTTSKPSSTSRDLGRSQGYDKIFTGQPATGDMARSSGLKDTTSRQPGYQGSDMSSGAHGAGMAGATHGTGLTQGYDRSGTTDVSKSKKMAQQSSMKDSTTPSTNISSGHNAPDMSSTTRDIGPTSGYNKSSSEMPESGDLSRSGMRDAAAKASGMTSGNQSSGMTNAAQNVGTSGAYKSNSEYIAVGEIAKKAGLGAAATGLAASAGSAIAGKSSGSGMKQGYQKSSAGHTSSTGDMDTNRSGIVEPTPSRTSGLDSGYQGSGYQGSGMAGTARDGPDLGQGYSTGGQEMRQKSTLGETTSSKTGGMDTGYQGAGMAGTTRDSNIMQGPQGSTAGTMGQKSSSGGTTAAESGGVGSEYQNVGTTGTTGGSGLSQGYSRSGMGETDQANLNDLDTSGLGEKSQDTDMKHTTSGSPSGRKPSLIQKAKRKIGLGSSDEKSPTMGDVAKSGVDQGYEKSGLKDQPGVDQAYQKAGLGDKAKSGIDGRYRGQGAGTQETTDVSPTSREMPQTGLGKTSKSTTDQEYGRSRLGATEGAGVAGAGAAGAGLAGTSKSNMGQGYQSSGMQDTSRGAGISDTSRSGMGQTYQSSGTAVTDNTTRTMPGSYDSYGTMDTSQGTGLADTSRSGVESSGLKDTTRSGMGQGHQTTGSGLSGSTQSAGHTYGAGNTYGSPGDAGLADTTKTGMSREHQSPETMVPAIGGSMAPKIAEEEEPPYREIRVPSSITTPRSNRRRSRVISDTRAGPSRPRKSSTVERAVDPTANQGYSKTGPGQGHMQSGLGQSTGTGMSQYATGQSHMPSGLSTTSDNAMGQTYSSSGLDKASGSAMDHPCPSCGRGPDHSQQKTVISSSTDKDNNYGQSYIGETARSGVDSRHESGRGGTMMSSMEQRSQQTGSSGMGSSRGYQRSTGMGESTEPGMHPLNQGHQSGIGEATTSGMNQGYQTSGYGPTQSSGTGIGQSEQRTGDLGSGTTGQGYQTTSSSHGQQGGQAMGEQRSQDYSAGDSSRKTKTPTTTGGSKVSQEALKGPQCPARDPYDFEKAIDGHGQKRYSGASPSDTTAGTTTKQVPSMSKAHKENLGPLDQMKEKFEKVIHPKK